ncbi:MAG TPA: hypothetical protein PKA55_14950 [Rhodoblastus sp.]|nr:hypothetical protein [Rhodoblastus sp.]
METLLEIVAQFVFELLLQAAFEILAEAGFHSLAAPFRTKQSRPLIAAGQALWGLIAGGLSLLAFPDAFLRDAGLRLANLVATPAAAAFVMMLIGRWRGARGQRVIALDQFGYAFVFALAMTSVRYVWAK